MSNKNRYIDFAREHSLPLFFQPQWMDMVNKNWDAAIVEVDGEIQMVWLYTVEKKIGLTLIRNPLLTPYLGPLYFSEKEETKEKYFSQLFQQLPKWDVMNLQCIPGFNTSVLFEKCQIPTTERVTYHLSLEPDEEKLWSQINSKQRYAIRQANRDLKIEDASHNYRLFYQLHRETLTSKGKKYPYTEDFFKKIFETTSRMKSSYITAAHNNNGDVVAMSFVVYDKKTMYLLLTSYDKKLRHNGGVAVLIWDAIQKAKKLGLKTFDFEGSMDRGIANFFKSFGGEKVVYLQAAANRSVLWKLKQWLGR